MRQGSNSKRPRGKGGNRGANGGRNVLSRSYDSNGPAGKVRGNPHQVHEKYLSMARDAQAEDPILAENLLQHADHYFRLIAEATGTKSRRDDGRRDDQSDQDDSRRDDSMDGDDSRTDDNRGNMAAGDADGQQPQASGGEEDGAQEAPKRTRRPRRSKAQQDSQESKSEEVASDAA